MQSDLSTTTTQVFLDFVSLVWTWVSGLPLDHYHPRIMGTSVMLSVYQGLPDPTPTWHLTWHEVRWNERSLCAATEGCMRTTVKSKNTPKTNQFCTRLEGLCKNSGSETVWRRGLFPHTYKWQLIQETRQRNTSVAPENNSAPLIGFNCWALVCSSLQVMLAFDWRTHAEHSTALPFPRSQLCFIRGRNRLVFIGPRTARDRKTVWPRGPSASSLLGH